MWFHQTEAVFRRDRISNQQTMYDYVVTSLRDIIQTTHPHPEDAYDRIKNRLVTDFAPPKWERIERILDHPDLGDRSAMMTTMQSQLPSGGVPGLLVQAVFMGRLPTEIKRLLCAKDFQSPHVPWSNMPTDFGTAVLPNLSSP